MAQEITDDNGYRWITIPEFVKHIGGAVKKRSVERGVQAGGVFYEYSDMLGGRRLIRSDALDRVMERRLAERQQSA